jgi:hypothetical protein
MKHMPMLILLIGALSLLILPGCGTRESLSPNSGRSLKMLFHVQAKKRSAMKVAPLTASEALGILETYEAGQNGKRGSRNSSRSRSSSRRPKASGAMTRLIRAE